MVNYKTDTLKWFRHLQPHERIEYMCNILQLCLPTELRYFGSYLENLASKDFSSFKETETLANNSTELEKAMISNGSIAKVTLYLSLINSKNILCADILYDFLINHGLVLANLESLEKVLLAYTMAAYHPAFKFSQHQILNKLQQYFEYQSKSQMHKKREECEPSKSPNTRIDDIEDIVIESVHASNNSCLYEVKVTRSFKFLSTVHRCRNDFEQLHQKITQQFSNDLKNGMSPKMNFDWDSDDLPSVLTKYLRHFLKLPPSILYSSTMQEFLFPSSAGTSNHVREAEVVKSSEMKVNPLLPNELVSTSSPVVFDIDKEYYPHSTECFPPYAYYPENPFWYTQPKFPITKGHFLPGNQKVHTMSSPSFIPPVCSISTEQPEHLITSMPTSFSTPHLKQSTVEPAVLLNQASHPDCTVQTRPVNNHSAHSNEHYQPETLRCSVQSGIISPSLPVCPPENPYPTSASPLTDNRTQMKYSATVTTVSGEQTSKSLPVLIKNGPESQMPPEIVESNVVSNKQRAIVHVPHIPAMSESVSDNPVVRTASTSHLINLTSNTDASSNPGDPVLTNRHNLVNVAHPVQSSPSGENSNNTHKNVRYSNEPVVSEVSPQPVTVPNTGNLPFMRNANLKAGYPCLCPDCRMIGQYPFPYPSIPQCFFAPNFSNIQSFPIFPYNFFPPFRPPSIAPPGTSAIIPPPPPPPPPQQQPRMNTCYNCGQMGHNGARCKAKSIEPRYNGEGSFQLNYTPSATPSNSLSSD